jgi:hypothetical protein
VSSIISATSIIDTIFIIVRPPINCMIIGKNISEATIG